MSAPGYESYRESGVRHIGDLPTHWSLVALKRVATFTYGDALAADVRGEGDIKVFGSNGPVGTHSAPNTSAPVVFVGRKGSCGALTWSDAAGFAIDTVYYVDPSCCRADLRWLYWTLHTLGLEHSSQDTGVPGLSREVAHSSPVPLPPPSEQAAIAAFLDRETGKIDALVEAQTRLIELLKEKRQAVISHAVTKGLDPAAPMKNSGVEWLGQVPAHWEVKRLSYVFSTISSGTTPPSDQAAYYDGEVNWVTTGELRERAILQTAKQVSDAALRTFSALKIYQPGTLLIAMYGATIGRLGWLAAPAATNQACCAFADPVGAETRFVFRYLQAARESIILLASGGGQPNISQEKLRSLPVPLPPMPEQAAIIDALDGQLQNIERLEEAAEVAITLLQERRAALISAAVTGKIDVRYLAPKQAEAA